MAGDQITPDGNSENPCLLPGYSRGEGKGIADLEGSDPSHVGLWRSEDEKGVIAESGKGPCALPSINTPFAYARKWSRCLLAFFVPRINAMRSYVTENKM